MNLKNILFNKNNKVQFFDLMFWVILAMVFPLSGGNLIFLQVIHLVIFICAAYYLGELLLNTVALLAAMPFLIKSGVFIIIGGIITGLLYLLFPARIIIYLLAAFFLVDLVVSRRVAFGFSWRSFICLVPFFIILFQTFELEYAVHERYNWWDGDYFFYTAITESLKSNHSIKNAVFHSGLAINYAVFPFVAPAALADFTGIPSQFVLWGVWGKLVPIICLGTLGYAIAKISELLFEQPLTDKKFYKRQLLSSFMLLFLAPVHYLKLLHFQLKDVLFFGEGYILPLGSPGFSLSLFGAGLLLLLVFQKGKWPLLHRALIVFLLCVVAGSKVAMFLPLVALLGGLAVVWLFKKDYQLFLTLLAALPFCIILYLFTTGSNDAVTKTALSLDGHYPNYFVMLAEKYGIPGSALKKIIAMTGISICMWLSLKLLVLMVAGFTLYKNNFKAISLILASIVAFVGSMLPGFFVNAYGVDGAGGYLFDARWDMAQFTRGGVFFVTLVAAVFVLFLVFEDKKAWIRKFAFTGICVWMGIISLGFFTNDYSNHTSKESPWYREVRKEFNLFHPELMAMMGHPDYSGQVLVTAGVHPWYCTGLRSDGGAHIMSRKAHSRNEEFKKIFDTSFSFKYRKRLSDSIRMLGVDYIIASPDDTKKFQQAERDSIIFKEKGSKWFYRLN